MVSEDRQKIVYCAGAQYAIEERRGMQQIAEILEGKGFETYLSFRDGIEFRFLEYARKADLEHKQKTELLGMMSRASFAIDTYQIAKRCHGLVFNMNGRTPEEGAVFKSSLAYATGLPMVLYKNDNRSIFNGKDNSMIMGLVADFTWINKPAEIPKVLIKKFTDVEKRNESKPPIPPYIERAVSIGETLWEILTEEQLKQLSDSGFRQQILDLKDRFTDLFIRRPIEI